MTEAQADREVVFVLTVEAAEDADRTFGDFGKKALAAQEKITRGVGDESIKRAKAAEQTERQSLARRVKQESDSIKARERIRDKAADESIKRTKKIEKERAATIKKAERDFSDANSRVSAANTKMTDSLHMFGEGLVKAGEGFVKLGLAGEEDIEKLVRGLVRLKGTVDLVRGGVEIYRGLTSAVKAYREAVVAATAAEEAIAVVRARGAATGVAGAAVGAGAAGASGIRRTAEGVAGGAAGGAVASKAGAATRASAVPGIAAGLAAAASWVAVLKELQEIATGDYGHPGTLTAWLGEREAKLAGWFGEKAGFDPMGRKHIERVQQARSAETVQATGIAESIRAESRGRQQLEVLERSRQEQIWTRQAKATGGTEDEQTRSVARRRATVAQLELESEQSILEAARQRRAEMTAHGGHMPSTMAKVHGEIEAAQERVVDAARRSIDAAKERLTIEKQVAATRISAAEDSIRKTRDEISLRQDFIKQERQRFMSAAERFGQLESTEQERLRKLMARARQGEDLTVKEWQALQGVGTERAESMARSAFRQRAWQAGFLGTFGEGERDKIRQYRQERQQLEIELKDKRDLKVEIQQDNAKLAREIGRYIAEEEDRLYRELTAQIRQETEKARTQINQDRRQAYEQGRDRLEASSRLARR